VRKEKAPLEIGGAREIVDVRRTEKQLPAPCKTDRPRTRLVGDPQVEVSPAVGPQKDEGIALRRSGRSIPARRPRRDLLRQHQPSPPPAPRAARCFFTFPAAVYAGQRCRPRPGRSGRFAGRITAGERGGRGRTRGSSSNQARRRRRRRRSRRSDGSGRPPVTAPSRTAGGREDVSTPSGDVSQPRMMIVLAAVGDRQIPSRRGGPMSPMRSQP